MKLSQQDRFIEEILRNLSGETIDRIDNILKALMYYTLIQYSEGELIRIPYFGAFKLVYKGDEITEEGRVAEIDPLYIPSNEVKLNVGMLEDISKNGGDISELPMIKELVRDIKSQFNCVLNETAS